MRNSVLITPFASPTTMPTNSPTMTATTTPLESASWAEMTPESA